MSLRLVLLTEIIAPYRIPVFNALARHEGIDLQVIFLAENDPALRQWLVYRDEIQFTYQVLPSWRQRLGKHNLLVNRGLGAALRQAAPDAILCGGYNYPASWESMLWARRNGVRFYLWVESNAHDQRSGRLLVESLKRKFVRNCDGFVVPGRSSLEYVKSFGVEEGAIFTAPNAVDTRRFAEEAGRVRDDCAMQREALGLPGRFFLFVGRLVAEKGVFDLLQAYVTLTAKLKEEIGLVFVGDGKERAALQRLAAGVEPGCIQFAGFAQREQLAAYYALADLLVFPTHTDTWGLVVNEAMACGLPIIATSVAGCTADLVRDGWNGRVIDAGNLEQLGSAMAEIASDSELRLRMGQRSRERILGYSPEACAAGIAEAVLSCEVPCRG
ncbi:MAG: glycosyltransferase family 4 protein [Acidobacteriia bacterium]|nr:glycosyltransferase family 4 protein [Terriglobia bacterium]